MKTALYFGCWNQPGHFLWDSNGKIVWRDNPVLSDFPWDADLLDARFLRNGKIDDIPTGRVYWTCGGRNAFWYAFFWWDRSVDKRGVCNSGFYVRGFGWPEAQAAFDYACSQFPFVVKRQQHTLVLQNL